LRERGDDEDGEIRDHQDAPSIAIGVTAADGRTDENAE